MVILCLTFGGTCAKLFTTAAPSYVPINNAQGFQFLHILIARDIFKCNIDPVITLATKTEASHKAQDRVGGGALSGLRSPGFVYHVWATCSVPQTSCLSLPQGLCTCCAICPQLSTQLAPSLPYVFIESFHLTFWLKVTSARTSHSLSPDPALLHRWNLEPAKLSQSPSVGSLPVCLPSFGSLPLPQCPASIGGQ